MHAPQLFVSLHGSIQELLQTIVLEEQVRDRVTRGREVATVVNTSVTVVRVGSIGI